MMAKFEACLNTVLSQQCLNHCRTDSPSTAYYTKLERLDGARRIVRLWNCLKIEQWLSGWQMRLASKRSVHEYDRYCISTMFRRLEAAVSPEGTYIGGAIPDIVLRSSRRSPNPISRTLPLKDQFSTITLESLTKKRFKRLHSKTRKTG